ncbi:DUF4905 domain-containing protein [Pedobacter sp. SD-b]|uniref:DUF4905 domain-containing protein n=1 Tax=Pedobacter segetis TaxID=2793069 RepID=A0ABS1BJ67_9SPHI|nr:DUF4905 domain-containing protein [Pedobacter segetis]MBK0382925.1 DUF4905 domain-containing protein [Pedobacter segetis]
MISNKYTSKHLHSNKEKQIIWKILLDDDEGTLVWESRDKDKRVCFNAYDFKQGKYLLQDFSFEEQWFLSAQSVKNNILYLSGFENEFAPVQKGIIAFDLISKRNLWQNFSIAVQQFAQDGLVVFDAKIAPRKFRLIDYNTGNAINDLDINTLPLLKNLANDILLPQIFNENKDWETLHQLKYDDLEILAGYRAKEGTFDQYILIKKNNEIIFEDILNKAIQKKAFDTFFIWQNKLIYIKNKSEIVSYLV